MITITEQGLSYVQYETDGTTDNFPLTFPYLKQGDVKVFLDGVETTAFTWLNSSEIQMDTAPADDQLLTLIRNTEQQERLVDFQDGGVLKEATLDLDSNQLFYLAQEALDSTARALAIDSTTSVIDAKNNRIIRVQDGIDPNDAVNVSQVTAISDAAFTAEANAATALSVANGIAATANTALANSVTALSTANDAQATAEGIEAIALDAQSTANQAQADATQALSEAGAAQTSADLAQDDATQALADTAAAQADIDAHEALTVAHGATGAVVGTTNTQTLTNKTMTTPVLNSPSIVTPSRSDVKQDTYANLVTYAASATNGQFAWATDTKQAFAIKDGLLASIGGSSASLATLFQLIAEEAIGGWSTGNNATFLGGGTVSGTFAKETSNPLHDLQSYKFTQAAGSLNDYVCSPAQAVARRFRGQQVTLFFPIVYNGSDNDIEIKLYDATNAQLITSSIFVKSTANSINNVSIIKANVQIPVTCASIRFGFQVKVLNSGKILEFDDVEISSNTLLYADVGYGSIGEIMAFPASSVPTGFINCDGTAVSRTAYAQLFSLLGITHGQGNGSTTFNLPDYRGKFLRGVDGTAGVDPDKLTRTAMATGGNTGNLVGSVQADENKAHTHTISVWNAAIGGIGNHAQGQVSSNSTQTTSSQGSEARPKNAYVNYYIRYQVSSPSGIITEPETFSTDTAPLVYAGSGTYTLATLANAPVGTYITFDYAANTNTRNQVVSTRPTQTDADMNANGIRLFTRAYNASSAASQPAAIAIQIGKGHKGVTKDLYKSTGKVTAGSLDLVIRGTANQSGATLKDYNEVTGILLLDTGWAIDVGVTSSTFNFTDVTTQTSGYLVINASKNPALVGLSTGAVAARGVNTAGTSIPNGSVTVMVLDAIKTFDTHGALNAATGVFTAPESGYYKVSGMVSWAASNSWSASQTASAYIYKNGVTHTQNAFGLQATMSSTNLSIPISDTVFLSKGDTVSIAAGHNKGSAASLITNGGANFFSITKTSVG